MTVPFAKVNEESRTVSGFATLDNVDRQGDVVDTEASIAAFKAFRGNIREMHQPIAAGRLLSFSQEEFYDPVEKKMFSGVFVTVYVSKGAQATWEKVLDGTLSGFSIGGNITDSTTVFDKSLDTTVRIIKAYDLVELSLVDSPANQLANVFSVVKAEDGTVTYKGLAVETEVETVFWCPSDQIAQLSKDDERTCDVCDGVMQNIGWIEASEVNKSDVIKQVVDNYLNTPEVSKQADTVNSEGGNDVEKQAEVVAEVEEVAESADETVEKAEVVTEEVTQEFDELFEKRLAETTDAIREGFEKNYSEQAEQIEELRKSLAEVAENVEKRLQTAEETLESLNAEVEKRFDAVDKAVQAVVDKLSKSLDDLDKRTAMKKSEELGRSSGTGQDNNPGEFWGGTFLSVSDL